MKFPQPFRSSTHSGLRHLQFPQISRNISRKIFDSNLLENSLKFIFTFLILMFAISVIWTMQSTNTQGPLYVIQKVSQDKVHLRKALLLLELGDDDFARTEIEEGLALNPQNIFLLDLYKKVSLGDTEKIERELEVTKRVLETRPDYAGAWIRLALIYEQLGNAKLADEARSRARRLNPEF